MKYGYHRRLRSAYGECRVYQTANGWCAEIGYSTPGNFEKWMSSCVSNFRTEKHALDFLKREGYELQEEEENEHLES